MTKVSNFFAKLVSPVILKNRIVATFMTVMFKLFDKHAQITDEILNDDI